MKRSDKVLISIVIGCVIVEVIVFTREDSPKPSLQARSNSELNLNPNSPARSDASRNSSPSFLDWRDIPSARRPQVPLVDRRNNPTIPESQNSPEAETEPLAAEPIIPESVARSALQFVGADPTANEVWFRAINDPNLSAEARQNLIEDLNEEGFPDPKNITTDDLPLIVNRLAIIEELAPTSMDETNAAAFQEAYKDLMIMLSRLSDQ